MHVRGVRGGAMGTGIERQAFSAPSAIRLALETGPITELVGPDGGAPPFLSMALADVSMAEGAPVDAGIALPDTLDVLKAPGTTTAPATPTVVATIGAPLGAPIGAPIGRDAHGAVVASGAPATAAPSSPVGPVGAVGAPRDRIRWHSRREMVWRETLPLFASKVARSAPSKARTRLETLNIRKLGSFEPICGRQTSTIFFKKIPPKETIV